MAHYAFEVLYGMEHIIDLTELFSGEAHSFSDEFTVDVCGLTDDIKKGCAYVKADAVSRAGNVEIALDIDLEYDAECSRCLKPLHLKNKMNKTVYVCMSLIDGDNDEYIVSENGKVDLAAAVNDLILLESPSKLLCKEDCKGLCIKCGADLNFGECGCERKEIDPRLAKLKEYLNKK